MRVGPGHCDGGDERWAVQDGRFVGRNRAQTKGGRKGRLRLMDRTDYLAPFFDLLVVVVLRPG